MKLKIEFSLAMTRRSGIQDEYRPDWLWLRKGTEGDPDAWHPPYHGGRLLLPAPIRPGARGEGTIFPTAPEFWQDVKPDDTLVAFEGPRAVGVALVLSVERGETDVT